MYSILIPWSNRPELALSLAANANIYRRHAAEIVVVNAGGDLGRLVSIVESTVTGNVKVIDLPNTSFNRSLALNIGTVLSTGDHLFCLDSDVILESDILAEADPILRSGNHYVSLLKIQESKSPPSDDADRPDWSFLAELIQTNEYVFVDGTRVVLKNWNGPGHHASHGQILLTRDAMFRSGGLNAALHGWGFEDTDFQVRLQRGLGLQCVSLGRATHLTHPRPRATGGSWGRNMNQATRNYSVGRFEGTLHEDARTWRDLHREVPVRRVTSQH